MPGKRLDRNTLDTYIARVEKITSDEQRLWGKMSATKMLMHLTTVAELSLGEHEAKDVSIPILSPIGYFLSVRVFTTWPGGVMKLPPSADYLFPEATDELDTIRTRLISKMREFVDALDADPTRKELEPFLGYISLHRWAYFHGVHNNHHLRQFGV